MLWPHSNEGEARDALSGTMRELSERLAADGWIEKVSGGGDAPAGSSPTTFSPIA